MDSSARSRGREAPGPGVRRTGPEEEVAPGVALCSRGTTVSPRVESNVGGPGMTSQPQKEVLHQRSSQRVPEGQRCDEATVSNKLSFFTKCPKWWVHVKVF